jgi:hypothetical protein
VSYLPVDVPILLGELGPAAQAASGLGEARGQKRH